MPSFSYPLVLFTTSYLILVLTQCWLQRGLFTRYNIHSHNYSMIIYTCNPLQRGLFDTIPHSLTLRNSVKKLKNIILCPFLPFFNRKIRFLLEKCGFLTKNDEKMWFLTKSVDFWLKSVVFWLKSVDFWLKSVVFWPKSVVFWLILSWFHHHSPIFFLNNRSKYR